MAVTTGTLLAIAAVASIAAAGVSVYSQQQAAKSQSALLNYNARLRDQEAADAQRDAKIRANQQREANRRFIGSQRAKGGGSGVLQSTGSPLEVLADSAQQLELSALETERTGNIQAGQLRQQAVFDRYSAKSVRRGANYASAGTILGTAGNVAGMYGGGYRGATA